jgi:hypothetical protein
MLHAFEFICAQRLAKPLPRLWLDRMSLLGMVPNGWQSRCRGVLADGGEPPHYSS